MAVTGNTGTISGFRNLLARENKVWWRSKRWLIVLVLGFGLNAFLAFALFALPPMAAAQGDSIDAAEAGLQIFFGMGFMLFALMVIILTQDAIIGERQTGIAEWVLSKPVSREAYIASKLIAATLPILVLMIGVQSAIGYGLFQLANVAVGWGYLAAVGLMTLHTLFYLILSVALGVLTENRGVLLAVSLGSLLGGSLLVNFAGPLTLWTPWPLGQLAGAFVLGVDLPAIMFASIGFTLVWCIVGLLVAFRGFARVEL